ncbi:hypothetical protein [Oleiharenicola sp. Vm1]|uniref:hypothetical protein n=1 Tax=Oleiharenicola sp. Vm1 TaxID=3398393 RepID=UPI0039F48BCF
MKLLFSEVRPNHADYVYPYAIWALPEAHETPADLLAAGFLPSNHALERFYLCRQLRVDLRKFAPSSENRRVLRKGEGIAATLVPRAEFEFTAARRDFCLAYTREKIPGMTPERLASLFANPVTTHVVVFREADGRELGYVTLYHEPGRMAFYYYAFYDLAAPRPNLGIFMMTWTVRMLAESGCTHAYLGTCYSAAALYKTQFAGGEFFNGCGWSASLEELKHLLHRQDDAAARGHLLESAAYREAFLPEGLAAAAARSRFAGR